MSENYSGCQQLESEDQTYKSSRQSALNGKTVVENPTFEFLLKQIALAHKKQVKDLQKKLAELERQNVVETRSVSTQTEWTCNCFLQNQCAAKSNASEKDISSTKWLNNEDKKETVNFGEPKWSINSPKSEKRKLSLKKNSKAKNPKFRNSFQELEEVKIEKELPRPESGRKEILVPETLPIDILNVSGPSGDEVGDLDKRDDHIVIPDSLDIDAKRFPVINEKGPKKVQKTDKMLAPRIESDCKVKQPTSRSIAKKNEPSVDVINLISPKQSQDLVPIKQCDTESPSIIDGVAGTHKAKINAKDNVKNAMENNTKLSQLQTNLKQSHSTPTGKNKPKDRKNLKFTTKYAVELEPPDPRRNIKMVQTKLTANPLLKAKNTGKNDQENASNASIADPNVFVQRSMSSESLVDVDETYFDSVNRHHGHSLDFDETFFDEVSLDKPSNKTSDEIVSKVCSNPAKLTTNNRIIESNSDNEIEAQFGKRGQSTRNTHEKTPKKRRTVEVSKAGETKHTGERKIGLNDAQRPKYTYEEGCVRRKEERRKLPAYDCHQCQQYYENLDLQGDEKHMRIQECSRHRSRNKRPDTPIHFWDLGFPDTQECKARGYMNPTQVIYLNRQHPEI